MVVVDDGDNDDVVVAPGRAFCLLPVAVLGMPLGSLVVGLLAVLFARLMPPPVTAFFALPLAWCVPGYLFPPSGVEEMAFVPLFASVLDAGREFERLTTGLRAVEGSAFGDGW